MLLQSHYLRQLNKIETAILREEQAKALAKAYDFSLPEKIDDVDSELFNEDEFIESIEKLYEK